MGTFWDNLFSRYKQGTIVTRLIYINLGIFLLLRLVLLVMGLLRQDGDFLVRYVQMPSDLQLLLLQPWTVFTYMFVHLEWMHVLFNMLWLYFFGNLFLRWFNARQLGGLYILGGLTGGLFFVLFYNMLPLFEGIQSSGYLIGASASVLALGIAVAYFRPDEPIQLFLLGSIKLKYIAIIMVVMDVLSLNGSNAGGNLAHLGGALTGLVFGYALRKGVDLTSWVNPILDEIVRRMHSRPKMKVVYRRSNQEQTYKTANVDQDYRDRKKKDNDRLDEILEKVKKSGYDSLSESEKKQLFDFSH